MNQPYENTREQEDETVEAAEPQTQLTQAESQTQGPLTGKPVETAQASEPKVQTKSASKRDRKAASAFRTISEVADILDVQQHVLRFWETKFSQIRPLKARGWASLLSPRGFGAFEENPSFVVHRRVYH